MFGVGFFGRAPFMGLYKDWRDLWFICSLWPLVVWRMSGDGAEPFLGCEDGVEF